VDGLGDEHMVFVGKGCSWSFQPAQFRGCTPGFYFHDDDSFNMPEMIAYGNNAWMHVPVQ
jgi:hypothetical protein